MDRVTIEEAREIQDGLSELTHRYMEVWIENHTSVMYGACDCGKPVDFEFVFTYDSNEVDIAESSCRNRECFERAVSKFIEDLKNEQMKVVELFQNKIDILQTMGLGSSTK
jgi:hypothetical protein